MNFIQTVAFCVHNLENVGFYLATIHIQFYFRQWEKDCGNIISIDLCSSICLSTFTGVNLSLLA